MPSNRQKRTRNTALDPHSYLFGLFLIGCGRSHVDVEWYKQQWAKHGRTFLNQGNHEGCWALSELGPPEDMKNAD